MSSDMAAALPAMAIETIESPFARAASGANRRPAIKKTASSRQRWIERFTRTVSHETAHDGKLGSITKPRGSLIQLDRTALRWINLMQGGRNIAEGQNIFAGCGLR